VREYFIIFLHLKIFDKKKIVYAFIFSSCWYSDMNR